MEGVGVVGFMQIFWWNFKISQQKGLLGGIDACSSFQ